MNRSVIRLLDIVETTVEVPSFEGEPIPSGTRGAVTLVRDDGVYEVELLLGVRTRRSEIAALTADQLRRVEPDPS